MGFPAAEEGDVLGALIARLDEIISERLRRADGDRAWLKALVDFRVRLDIALRRRETTRSPIVASSRSRRARWARAPPRTNKERSDEKKTGRHSRRVPPRRPVREGKP